MSEYVCPNGHPFPSVVAVECDECGAAVACVPFAEVLKVREAVRVALDTSTTHSELLHAVLEIRMSLP